VKSNLQRIWVTVDSVYQWYDVIHECRSWFGHNWRGQKKVKRRFDEFPFMSVDVWFEVPNTQIASWISVKMSIPAWIPKNFCQVIARAPDK